MTLKNTVRIILTGLFLTGCSSTGMLHRGSPTVENPVFMDGDILVQNDESFGLGIIGFKDDFEIIYAPSGPPTLEQAAKNRPYRYLINGSYFEADRVHAGWLSIFGKQHTPLKPARQLSHVAIPDTGLGYLDFPDLELWDASLSNTKAN